MRRSAIFAAVMFASAAKACLVIVPEGKTPVAIAGETAVIVWDAKTHTEHFIRTAEFEGATGSMGFLVPTPSTPDLRPLKSEEAYRRALESFANLLPAPVKGPPSQAGRLRSKDSDSSSPTDRARAGSAPGRLAGGSLIDAKRVDVVSRGQIGSYETAVLRANQPGALLGWLKRNGFASDARLGSWIGPYVERGWAITAFRFRPEGAAFSSAPMMISFRTPSPFYPYREPTATNAPASRSLRIYLVAPERRAGRLENGPWATQAGYVGGLGRNDSGSLEKALGLSGESLRGRWLTSFDDRRPVRRASDLVFDPAPLVRREGPRPLARVPERSAVRSLAAAALGGPLAWGLWTFTRRRRRI